MKANEETRLMSCRDNMETYVLFLTSARRKIPQKCEVAEMPSFKEYAFVLDANGQQLDPTRVNNAWRLVRQKKLNLFLNFQWLYN